MRQTITPPALHRTIIAAALSLLGAHAAAAAETHDIAKTDASVVVGQSGSSSVTITAKNGWHVNGEAPISVKLMPAPGVTVDKTKLTRADLTESTAQKARFDIKFTATEPGKKSIAAEAQFVMCQATACQPVKETLTLALDVTSPAAVPAPAKKKRAVQ